MSLIFMFLSFIASSAYLFPWQADSQLETQSDKNHFVGPEKWKSHVLYMPYLSGTQIFSLFFLIRWTFRIINIQTYSIMYDVVLL